MSTHNRIPKIRKTKSAVYWCSAINATNTIGYSAYPTSSFYKLVENPSIEDFYKWLDKVTNGHTKYVIVNTGVVQV